MLLSRVQQTLRQRRLLTNVSRLLVACSGGPDSQALLHVLYGLRHEHGCKLLAVSVHHGLRADAFQDVERARELAEQLAVPFEVRTLKVPAGPSLQAQARKARYQVLHACAREHGADAIAVGHTRDDQAETVLARLLRGASLEGLTAIAPRREDGVVRPLIDAGRAQVEAYLMRHGVSWARDPSNQDRRFARARIRHDLLPALRAENPRLDHSLAQLADDARGAVALTTERVWELWSQSDGDVTPLRTQSAYLRRRWLLLWADRALDGVRLTRRHLDALDRLALSGGGEVRLPGDVSVSLSPHERLVVSKNAKRGRGSTRRS